jgi:putative transposase
LDHTLVSFDEAGFRLVPVYKRVWFIRGHRPQGVFFWSNKKSNILGALINGKKLYYKWHESLNTLTFLGFLKSLLQQLPKGKYVFVLDNARYHKSSTILRYFKSLDENIKIEFIPPYSPELNPTETCWKIIRQQVTNSTYFQSIDFMKSNVDKFLQEHEFNLNPSNYLCR